MLSAFFARVHFELKLKIQVSCSKRVHFELKLKIQVSCSKTLLLILESKLDLVPSVTVDQIWMYSLAISNYCLLFKNQCYVE